MNYIGSSASVVLINDNNIITADLGATKVLLFNKDGNILNSKDYRNPKNFGDHTFNSLEEKKRIKRFNKNIDYHNLKLNFYVPVSRSFGFFKFKDNPILKEENQIISCVPDVYIYDRNNVDYILLITRGGVPAGDSFKKLLEKIKNISDPQSTKLTELINEYLNNKKEETEKIKNKNINNTSTQTNKQTQKSNSIYIGKEDFGEENLIISELNNTYYKDILSLNKSNDCNGDYNTTCILIQLLKDKKSDIIPTTEENTKNEKKENDKKDETNSENKNEIKDNNKNEIKIKNDETKIKEENKKEEDKKE
jgi:hypothetical protein